MYPINNKNKNEDNIFIQIRALPDCLINIIKEFTPKVVFIFTNRENYSLYHSLIKKYINNYENYIRDTIRRDNEFVFEKIIEENLERWVLIKNYKYKKYNFKNYLYFVVYYCIENDSNNCRSVINNFCSEHGLCKNLYKKNVVQYIRWRN
jgi:c-di-AMP phosphodiesterase-like protein